jgi:hypothetical protein
LAENEDYLTLITYQQLLQHEQTRENSVGSVIPDCHIDSGCPCQTPTKEKNHLAAGGVVFEFRGALKAGFYKNNQLNYS